MRVSFKEPSKSRKNDGIVSILVMWACSTAFRSIQDPILAQCPCRLREITACRLVRTISSSKQHVIEAISRLSHQAGPKTAQKNTSQVSPYRYYGYHGWVKPTNAIVQKHMVYRGWFQNRGGTLGSDPLGVLNLQPNSDLLCNVI